MKAAQPSRARLWLGLTKAKWSDQWLRLLEVYHQNKSLKERSCIAKL
jgi:hypothetical protein